MSEYTETKRGPAESPARDDEPTLATLDKEQLRDLTPNRFDADEVRGGLKHEITSLNPSGG